MRIQIWDDLKYNLQIFRRNFPRWKCISKFARAIVMDTFHKPWRAFSTSNLQYNGIATHSNFQNGAIHVQKIQKKSGKTRYLHVEVFWGWYLWYLSWHANHLVGIDDVLQMVRMVCTGFDYFSNRSLCPEIMGHINQSKPN